MKYQFRSWVRLKSDKIIREYETYWSPCTWLHSDCAMEANDADKLTRVLIQKEVRPRRRNDVFSRALLSGIGASDYQIWISYILPYIRSNSPIFSYISGQISYISPIFQVQISYILLYFRSKSPIFSPISYIFWVTSGLTPCDNFKTRNRLYIMALPFWAIWQDDCLVIGKKIRSYGPSLI